MADDRFEKFKQIAKDEFGVSIVKTDNSKTSQTLLDELKAELKTEVIDMVDAREFLNYVKSHLVANGGNVGSHEIHFEYLEEWLEEVEKQNHIKE